MASSKERNRDDADDPTKTHNVLQSKSSSNSSDEDEVITLPRRKKPAIRAIDSVDTNPLFSRLSTFLPMLAQANHVLDDDRRLGRLDAKQLESVEEGEEHIEMNLGLGVLEYKIDDDLSSSSSSSSDDSRDDGSINGDGSSEDGVSLSDVEERKEDTTAGDISRIVDSLTPPPKRNRLHQGRRINLHELQPGGMTKEEGRTSIALPRKLSPAATTTTVRTTNGDKRKRNRRVKCNVDRPNPFKILTPTRDDYNDNNDDDVDDINRFSHRYPRHIITKMTIEQPETQSETDVETDVDVDVDVDVEMGMGIRTRSKRAVKARPRPKIEVL